MIFFIRAPVTDDEIKVIKYNMVKIKKLGLEKNKRITKTAIVKKVFLELLKDDEFVKKIIG